MSRKDPLGLWYTDVNFSIGYIGGITVGWMETEAGFYPYIGYGLMTPGLSVTTSPSDPTKGWNIALQVSKIVAGQIGISENDAQWFWEVGLSIPGVSLTRYYVFDLVEDPRSKPLKSVKCH